MGTEVHEDLHKFYVQETTRDARRRRVKIVLKIAGYIFVGLGIF